MSSTGNVALIDLGAQTYQGFEGGLYPGGSNVPPAEHLQHALEAARAIQPLDAQGAPDPQNGLIVLLSVGLSNAAHEFAEFERQQDVNGLRNPRLVLVNGAQAGQSSDAIDDPAAWYWQLVDRRLAALELSPAQVQVAWLRQSRAPAFQAAIARSRGEPRPEERSSRTFPAPAQRLRDELEQIAMILRQYFPNLRLCYVSDRTFHGYKDGFEPNAYEAGFAVKWLIEAQIGGKAELAFGADGETPCAPLLLWGPYLWADGELPNGQGTYWLREDFEVERPDHPSRQGELKVAGLLDDFFAADPSATPWYSRGDGTGDVELVLREAVADAYVEIKRPTANFGSSPALLSSDSGGRAVAYLRFDLTGVRRPVLHAKLSLRNVEAEDPSDPLGVHLVADDGWDEGLLCHENAPELGSSLGTIPRASRDSTRALAVTAAVNQETDAFLTLAVTAKPDGPPSAFLSRESGSAPRLVIIERRE